MAWQDSTVKSTRPQTDSIAALARAKAPARLQIQGLWGSAKAYYLAQVFRHSKRPLFVVCAGRREAEDWVENLKTCLWDDADVSPLILEGWELPAIPSRPSLENASERTLVLEKLLGGERSSIIVATVSGALQLLLSKKEYGRMRMRVARGDSLDLGTFLQTLARWGYERTPLVEKKGDFAVHGGIVDVYPVASDNPLRVELSGDRVASLRYFDALSQRSRENAQEAVIHAVNEWEALRRAQPDHCVLDYASKEALVVLDEPLELQAMDSRTQSQDGLLPIPRLPFAGFAGRAATHACASLSVLPQGLPGWQNTPVLALRAQAIDMALGIRLNAGGDLARDPAHVLAQMEQWMQKGYEGSFVFQNEGEKSRLFQWAAENGLDKPWLRKVCAVLGNMESGFISETFRAVFLTDRDIFGRAKIRRPAKRFHGTSPLGEFLELAVGDFVVHQRHGIGRYRGVQRISKNGAEAEYLSIEYADKAKLHVPLDQAYLVQKYMGVGDRPITVDQLGSKRWENTKARVLAATMKIAKDLLAVQAARRSLQGIPYSKDSAWQREFEDAFAYEETPDQITSIADVKRDMENPRPMDRLICGDVGYGKTEVAIRAAFKAVMDHRQVAVLVPTTILAQQHFLTFADRMAEYPVRVEMLSRFRHPDQVRRILLDLVEGKIDIVIGTHRLLQPDLRFKDLGLVIIDEEQRFGVRHKEAFKQLRRLVDVLTLTATPIPRTLYLSLLGTKEMSSINTPPQDRLPVETVLAEFGDDVIRRAIRYELAREGQVYFVHNRVRSIEKVRQDIQRLVPEARVVCAHGQMQEDLLSDIMSRFVEGRSDVLVTTTIIESGLDIPNANTLLVDRADLFGLSELYQLRGRVGRFKNKAYAYFLLPKEKVLLDAAKKRLKAIADCTALGSGFKIAMRDLEIRGAGNILGHQQHGHIAAVGFDLYCQLLKQSVARLKAIALPRDEEVTVKIGGDLMIPVDYVPSEAMRMDLYRRVSSAVEERQVDEMRREIEDRFGKPPLQVAQFLDVAKLRIMARQKGVFFIEKKEGKWRLHQGKELVSEDGRLPVSRAKDMSDAVGELKNVLSKLPDAIRISDSLEVTP